jgi:hypothetical protein
VLVGHLDFRIPVGHGLLEYLGFLHADFLIGTSSSLPHSTNSQNTSLRKGQGCVELLPSTFDTGC